MGALGFSFVESISNSLGLRSDLDPFVRTKWSSASRLRGPSRENIAAGDPLPCVVTRGGRDLGAYERAHSVAGVQPERRPLMAAATRGSDDAREAQGIVRTLPASGDAVACSPSAWTRTLAAAGRDVGARSLCAASPVARAHLSIGQFGDPLGSRRFRAASPEIADVSRRQPDGGGRFAVERAADPSMGALRPIDGAVVVERRLRSTTRRSTAICSIEADFVESRFDYSEPYSMDIDKVSRRRRASAAVRERGARLTVAVF